MKFLRPRKLLSGFHCDDPDPLVPSLTHLGEQWAPADWEVAWHAHHTWEFYLQVEGQSIWETKPKKQYALNPGGLLAVPPDFPHRLIRPAKSHHYIFAGLDVSQFLNESRASFELNQFWCQGNCFCSHNAASILPPFRQLIREASILLPYRTEGIRSALQSLILEATRIFQSIHEKPLVPAHHPAVAHAKHLMEGQPSEKWKLSDLARLSGVSANHLVELFSGELGISPHQYLIQQRVEASGHLLKTSGLSITQIALEAGFSSSQHFSKIFSQFTGKTPSQWRNASTAKTPRKWRGVKDQFKLQRTASIPKNGGS
ncbi:AraC family transcriptional regulator [Oscillatoria amoena NRMC-F 0135]|uniref:AraC family transcriptional regulator n=1 Tax=Geitlerinema calcuttense NRMC-F 0142 TaxID=2922238 RepID=A0ABT7M317_9CYAN|nr:MULTISPECIES: AraC family transcriptional regulator [Cyanophyceae]MDL5050401.1 AraC family transcriptional regulator [Oscillatoria amoena NRMC-F 0135]MDL5054201.1 AraC family transcriptional regulator [Oscillatoria laete-virens NRMC-F 0139]MDL5057451.1 AraC family transcriptional regulator [Geitlerinema calcuttense NRMC-F 0142]